MHHQLLTYLLILFLPLLGTSSSWGEAKKNKTATLKLNWFTSTPFIYENEKGRLTGVEYEIMNLFKEYLKTAHQVNLTLEWEKAKDFGSILEFTRKDPKLNSFSLSALSITDERLKFSQFTNSYLPDITVLVSSKGTPTLSSYDEIYDMMSKMQAITVRHTKYETFLNNIKKQLNIDFDISYINSEQNILDEINNGPNKFGFIDLPAYLMLIKDGGEMTRQNFFTVKGNGYGLMAPLESDWVEPFNEFMEKEQSKISDIISSYLGVDLHNFIENLYTGEQLSTSILVKEKELQNALIKSANLSIEKGKMVNRTLIIATSVTGVLLLIIVVLYVKNRKKTDLLIGQRDQIEEHEDDIQQKNDQLLNRNTQLVALNEEKNNLVRILAHDLRSPLSQIMGLSDLLVKTKSKVTGDEKVMMEMLGKSAFQINEMVNKILDIDGLEGNRLKVLRERVDTRLILDDIGGRYIKQAKAKSITLKVSKCDKWHTIWTDHLLLMLLLENLVSNAVKFSPPNTTIKLETQCEYDNVLFKVTDEGPGFTEEDKKLVFTKFQKLSAKPTGDETSTGLGLSIVKKYVNDLKGEIWLESEEGKGSTFYVKLSV